VTNFRKSRRGGPPPYEFLSRITVFIGLKPEIAERVIASGSVVTLTRGETLFRQGDRATAFFIVVDGWVKLYRTTFSGEEVVLDVLTKAESVAVAAALSGDCYAATAAAVSDACVVRIPAERVVRCIRKMPEIAVSMAASTLQHIDRLTQQIEQLKAQSTVPRVAAFLASLCPVDDGPCMIALPYAKALIAARLGMKPESLSRVFFKLKSVGVQVYASQFAVRDVGRLRQLAASGHIRSSSALSFERASSPDAPSDSPTRTHLVERGLAAVADDLHFLGQRLERVVTRLDDLEAQLTDLNRRLDALEESAGGIKGFA
jgi:CRP-like cAMP-binding protein